jgi:hypothetical protein
MVTNVRQVVDGWAPVSPLRTSSPPQKEGCSAAMGRCISRTTGGLTFVSRWGENAPCTAARNAEKPWSCMCTLCALSPPPLASCTHTIPAAVASQLVVSVLASCVAGDPQEPGTSSCTASAALLPGEDPPALTYCGAPTRLCSKRPIRNVESCRDVTAERCGWMAHRRPRRMARGYLCLHPSCLTSRHLHAWYTGGVGCTTGGVELV